MGDQFCFGSKKHHNQPNMKIFLLVALAIAIVMAEPEAEANADPHYGYPGYGFGYPYRHGVGYYGHPLRTLQGYYPYRYGHTLGKREAEADPAVLSSAPSVLENIGTFGHYAHPAYLHPHHKLPILKKTIIGAEANPVVKVEDITTRVLNAPYGAPYRYGPTGEVLTTRVLNAPYGAPYRFGPTVEGVKTHGAPYRYGPTVSGVGPPADAFGR